MKQPLIPIARPWLDELEAEAARRPIMSGWVTQGPEVEAFEKEFAAEVGSRHACATSSCTTALHLALLAAGVRAGDEVITVSHSFIATVNSILYCGAKPVFVDIAPDTFNIDPALLEKARTPKTRAILCVHQMGMPCDLAVIIDWAKPLGIPVVEDAACAIGSRILWKGQWEMIGKPHGVAACFSFHPRKVLTTGDGGMITTNDDALDSKFRLWRQHSMTVSDQVRHRASTVVFESYSELGFNYRMTDIQAAIGREQLKRLGSLVTARRRLATRYQTLLAKVPGVIAPADLPWTQSNWQSYCIRLPAGANQAGVMQAMMEQGVSTRRGIMCSHREPAYRESHGDVSLPNSEAATDGSIIIPLFPQMTDAEQDQVVDALVKSLAQTST